MQYFQKKNKRLNSNAFINPQLKIAKSLNHSDYFGKMFIVNIGKEGIKIEANKIDMISSKQLFNTNIQKKFLTGKELQCVNNLLKQRMVDDMIQKQVTDISYRFSNLTHFAYIKDINLVQQKWLV